MESLGFDNTSSVWTESPLIVQARTDSQPTSASVGRHEAEHDPIAEWQPQDFGRRLDGRDFRWSLLLLVFAVVATAGAFGYWIYQQPARQAEASAAVVAEEAAGLREALPDLVAFSSTLDDKASSSQPEDLFTVDSAARALFDASAQLDQDDAESRSAAAAASGAALDGIRLAGDTRAYQNAVTPILVLPGLETDPSLIELDEAARSFGEWQLRYDEVRSALPDGVLTDVTEQLDIISADLATFLTRYLDALREDSQGDADAVLTELAGRLDGVSTQIGQSVATINERIATRVEEAQASLDELLGS